MKIKKCAHCNEVVLKVEGRNTECFWVECKNVECHFMGPECGSKDEAIKAWNDTHHIPIHKGGEDLPSTNYVIINPLFTRYWTWAKRELISDETYWIDPCDLPDIPEEDPYKEWMETQRVGPKRGITLKDAFEAGRDSK